MAARGSATADLFGDPAQVAPGSCSCSIEIAHTMSEAIDKCREAGVDRERIADRMSYLLGDKVSVAMLNAYTAPSRETHQINVERAIAFDAAVHAVIDQRVLLPLQARHAGERVVSKAEAAHIELGRIYLQERELRERKRALQIILREP
jgi:hypothetical protein